MVLLQAQAALQRGDAVAELHRHGQADRGTLCWGQQTLLEQRHAVMTPTHGFDPTCNDVLCMLIIHRVYFIVFP